MPDEIGVGIVGYGLGGRVFHAPFVSAVPGLRLKAVMTSRVAELAAAYPGLRVELSLDGLLADSSIRLVVVSTPNETHAQIAKRCLEAGRHVVIDKPFSATSEEATELLLLARSKGLLAIPFHNRRWDGDFETVQKILAERSLGRLVTFESHFDRFRPLPRENSWKEGASPANGMLFDLGPHLVDQCLALFGAPDYILASVRTDRDQSDIEDAFDITLGYSTDGRRMLAHCRSSYLAADRAPRFLLHGTRGSFRKDGVDPQEPALVAGAKVPVMSSQQDWLREPESAWGTLTTAPDPAQPSVLVTRKVPTLPGDYREFYANVRDAINGAAPLAVTGEDGFRAIRLLELARLSSAERRAIDVRFKS